METICERASLVKKTLHIYGWLFLAWLLFLILYGGYEVAEKGAAINKAVVLVILNLFAIPFFGLLPIGASFFYAHILDRAARTGNIFAAWVMSFAVIPVTIAGFCCTSIASRDPLYGILGGFLGIVMISSLFRMKMKDIFTLFVIYILYFAEMFVLVNVL